MTEILLLRYTDDHIANVFMDGIRVPNQKVTNIWAAFIEEGECPICGAAIGEDYDPSKIEVSDNHVCPECGVNVAHFNHVSCTESQEAILKAYKAWHHRCNVCGKEIEDWENRHSYHEPDCPKRMTQGKHKFIGEVWCNCDLNAHPGCCPDCNPKPSEGVSDD